MIGPAAVVAYDGPARSPEWHIARRSGITATDAVKIVTRQYGDALTVYADKRIGPVLGPVSKAAQLGIDYEPAAAAIFARNYSCTLLEPPILRSLAHPWALASLDRIAYRDDWPEPRVVEIKNRGYRTGTWDGDVPLDVFVQVQWQLMVSGFTLAHVALAVTGAGFDVWDVPRDDAYIAWLLGQCEPIWAAVQDGVEPPAGEGSLPALDRLHPDRQGTVDLDDDAIAALADYVHARDDYTEAEREKSACHARLVQLLGDAEVGLIDGRKAVSYTLTTRRGLDLKALRDDLPAEFLAGYETCTTTRTLRLGKGAT